MKRLNEMRLKNTGHMTRKDVTPPLLEAQFSPPRIWWEWMLDPFWSTVSAFGKLNQDIVVVSPARLQQPLGNAGGNVATCSIAMRDSFFF